MFGSGLESGRSGLESGDSNLESEGSALAQCWGLCALVWLRVEVWRLRFGSALESRSSLGVWSCFFVSGLDSEGSGLESGASLESEGLDFRVWRFWFGSELESRNSDVAQNQSLAAG